MGHGKIVIMIEERSVHFDTDQVANLVEKYGMVPQQVSVTGADIPQSRLSISIKHCLSQRQMLVFLPSDSEIYCSIIQIHSMPRIPAACTYISELFLPFEVKLTPKST